MYDKLIEQLIGNKAKKVIHYLSSKEIIRVVRTSYGGKFLKGNLEFTVTKGKPNYVERENAKDMGTKVSGWTYFKYFPEKKKNPKK